ncbi:MAG: hypothetical protein RLZZ306_105 [Bacteroidota bacterium]
MRLFYRYYAILYDKSTILFNGLIMKSYRIMVKYYQICINTNK